MFNSQTKRQKLPDKLVKIRGVLKLIVNPSRVKLYEHVSSFSCDFKSGVEMCEIEKKVHRNASKEPA